MKLLEKGVNIPCPESVDIGADVNPERISAEGVTIHSGCKIYGADTLIMPGVELGSEAPVTLYNCQVGRNVKLKGGSFHDSCFLDGVSIGSGAQVREACLLEEGARAAHCVGLKQTILFPFVTLGSLINFCDCLMAGGTDERNHSEVGSAYIHFNYTPNQDKATASLMGDVPRGVMINQPPIFLGGQGGVVGPVRIGYGVVVAAGTLIRKDLLEENRIILGHTLIPKSMPFHMGLYTHIKRIIFQNTLFIANLTALRRWYVDVRSLFMKSSTMERALLKGALDKLEKSIAERVKRLGQVAERMPQSIEIYQKAARGVPSEGIIQKKREFFEKWPDVEAVFKDAAGWYGDSTLGKRFLAIVEKAIQNMGADYLRVIKGLSEEDSNVGYQWLQGLVNDICSRVWEKLPSIYSGVGN